MKIFIPAIIKYLLPLPFVLIFSMSVFAGDTSEVLVTINDDLVVTDKNLEEAIRSSPFYTQFNTMGENEQASLRGNFLKRLVVARLLTIEAKKEKLDESAAFKKDIALFRKGLLYRYYMDTLKSKIKIPPAELDTMRAEYKGNGDAYSAAKSTYITRQYATLYQLTIKSLRDKYHVVLYKDRIAATASPETIILQGNGGIEITMADIYQQNKKNPQKLPHQDELLEKTYQFAELLVVAKAAEDEGVDVSDKVNSYKEERLPALYLENKQQQWVSKKDALRNYYVKHPEASFIPQRWHLGMIVLATEDEANKVLQRINKGESLFKLAGELSIDPYGREHLGDMGWVREQSGNPIIENAIKDLDDGQISAIIKTQKGYHIATILDRRPGGKRRFISMHDKISQLVINEQMHLYLQELQAKHSIVWSVIKDKRAYNKSS